MSKMSRLIKKGAYAETYELLSSSCDVYSLEKLLEHIPGVKEKEIFTFLVYAITREDTEDKYITICDLLMYLNQFIDDNYSLIRWYANRAIQTFPDSVSMKEWIVDTYFGTPTPPFSNSEIRQYAEDILKHNPQHCLSLEVLSKND